MCADEFAYSARERAAQSLLRADGLRATAERKRRAAAEAEAYAKRLREEASDFDSKARICEATEVALDAEYGPRVHA